MSGEIKNGEGTLDLITVLVEAKEILDRAEQMQRKQALIIEELRSNVRRLTELCHGATEVSVPAEESTAPPETIRILPPSHPLWDALSRVRLPRQRNPDEQHPEMIDDPDFHRLGMICQESLLRTTSGERGFLLILDRLLRDGEQTTVELAEKIGGWVHTTVYKKLNAHAPWMNFTNWQLKKTSRRGVPQEDLKFKLLYVPEPPFQFADSELEVRTMLAIDRWRAARGLIRDEESVPVAPRLKQLIGTLIQAKASKTPSISFKELEESFNCNAGALSRMAPQLAEIVGCTFDEKRQCFHFPGSIGSCRK